MCLVEGLQKGQGIQGLPACRLNPPSRHTCHVLHCLGAMGCPRDSHVDSVDNTWQHNDTQCDNMWKHVGMLLSRSIFGFTCHSQLLRWTHWLSPQDPAFQPAPNTQGPSAQTQAGPQKPVPNILRSNLLIMSINFKVYFESKFGWNSASLCSPSLHWL